MSTSCLFPSAISYVRPIKKLLSFEKKKYFIVPFVFAMKIKESSPSPTTKTSNRSTPLVRAVYICFLSIGFINNMFDLSAYSLFTFNSFDLNFVWYNIRKRNENQNKLHDDKLLLIKGGTGDEYSHHSTK